MFIDDGEAGMWIEFENAEDNVYEEGDKLSIHLYGQKLSIDSYCNSIKLDELASSCVKTVLPGSELTPVVLESFADISKYENRLVTIKDVEFVLPYGTLVNINEAGYLGVEQKSLYMGRWEDLAFSRRTYMKCMLSQHFLCCPHFLNIEPIFRDYYPEQRISLVSVKNIR